MLSEDEIALLEKNNCDWIAKSRFKEFAVDKGSVFSNIYNNDTHYIKQAVSIANSVLDNNYPDVEISILVLVPIISVILMLFGAVWIEERKNKRNNDENVFVRV